MVINSQNAQYGWRGTLSPDPVVGDLTRPQGLNAYSYVANNPLTFTDPTGFEVRYMDGECGKTDCAGEPAYGYGNAAVDEVIVTTDRHQDPCPTGICDPTRIGLITDALNEALLRQRLGESIEKTLKDLETRVKEALKRLSGPQGAKDHRYDINIITRCSADRAFEVVRGPGNSAPGAPYARSGTHDLVLTGNNPITQTVDPSSRTITNVTGPTHEFNPGAVVIRVNDLGNGYSSINITGTGSGDNPAFNNLAGGLLFGGMAHSVADYCSAASGTPSLKN